MISVLTGRLSLDRIQSSVAVQTIEGKRVDAAQPTGPSMASQLEFVVHILLTSMRGNISSLHLSVLRGGSLKARAFGHPKHAKKVTYHDTPNLAPG